MKSSVVENIIIMTYLMDKLGVDVDWYKSPNPALSNATPESVVLRGDGDVLIEWMEVRLGLRPGSGF